MTWGQCNKLIATESGIRFRVRVSVLLAGAVSTCGSSLRAQTGLASGLALAVRPAGLAEVSGVNGAPQARPAQREAKHR
jgi:hypothetical protein